MIGVFAFFVSYTISDWVFMLCEALDIALNPLVIILISFPVTMAITIGIKILDDKSKRW